MKTFVFFIVLLFYETAVSQISAYGSASYGSSSNPLYNYQKLSDQLLQTYVEVTSNHEMEDSQFRVQYIGGSMVFRRFQLRSYYEHRLSAGFDTPLFSADEEDEIINDSSVTMFLNDFQISARHDKQAYQEFDNYGIISSNALRFPMNENTNGKIANKAELRTYPHLQSYNNFSNIISFNIENKISESWNVGFSVGGGIKYFPNAKYNTSLFEETRTYVITTVLDSVLTGVGKQKHWEYYTYEDTSESEKMVLQNPKTRTAYQIVFGGFVQKLFPDGSLQVDIIYRINSHSTLLTMVQNLSTLTLNEDLYNSVFNAHGPELHGIVKYILPLNIQLLMNADLEYKIFETPAYDLVSGEIKNNSRIDTRAAIEMYLSRYFTITENLGVDVSISAIVLRNISNDPYNDYSVNGFSLSLEIGL